jgi:putative ABC transport system permease protein|nr:FtsX-like permease family protein [Candidatus Acidoferrales bacterium]
MKYFRLLRVSLLRKKFRTSLTIGSFAVAMFLFGLLITIRTSFNQGVEVAGADRIIVMNRITFIQPLPQAYAGRLSVIPGIKEITHATWFGGIYQDEKNFFPQFAIDPESWHVMYPEYVVPDDQWKTFLNDREGAVVGEGTAKRFGWKVGDRVPLKGAIYTGNWEFNIDGIYKGTRKADDTTQFWFHYDHLNESPAMFYKNTVGWYVVRLNNPDDATGVVKKIDDTFANSSYETKSATELAFAAGFAKQTGNIEFLMLSIGAIVFFTLLLVTGNTMAIAVRERTPELAILKALGYSNGFILIYVIAESVSIAVIGGVIGLGLAKLVTLGGSPVPSMLPLFYLPMGQAGYGVIVALVIGGLAGLIPAITASRLRVVDALRKA